MEFLAASSLALLAIFYSHSLAIDKNIELIGLGEESSAIAACTQASQLITFARASGNGFESNASFNEFINGANYSLWVAPGAIAIHVNGNAYTCRYSGDAENLTGETLFEAAKEFHVKNEGGKIIIG